MMIIGCDLHTRYQQIAIAGYGDGRGKWERRLEHENGERRELFYSALQEPVRVGIEATGQHALVRGHAGRVWGTSCGWEMRRRFGASVIRKQKDGRAGRGATC